MYVLSSLHIQLAVLKRWIKGEEFSFSFSLMGGDESIYIVLTFKIFLLKWSKSKSLQAWHYRMDYYPPKTTTNMGRNPNGDSDPNATYEVEWQSFVDKLHNQNGSMNCLDKYLSLRHCTSGTLEQVVGQANRLS